MCAGAIELLPHLVETVNRAGRVGVVGEEIAVRQLEWTGGQIIDVGDARVRSVRGQASAAGDEILIVISGQAVFGSLGEANAVAGDIGILGAAREWGGEH